MTHDELRWLSPDEARASAMQAGRLRTVALLDLIAHLDGLEVQ